jgi:carboxypeptidase C (cathepsin A)
MKKSLTACMFGLLLFGLCTRPTAAQEPNKDSKPSADAKAAADAKTPADANPPKEEAWVTDHTTRIGGQSIAYKATASLTMLKDDKGDPTALLFSTAYTRSDMKDASTRPIAFIYNGGPGSSSIWLHMGAFGPRRVVNPDAAPTPPAPYRIEDNANSLLDKADLVFIDPVGTGFSRAVGKAQNKDFWGVDQDVKMFAQFINTYVSRNNRWNSPKFLIGESYGTFRSAALSNYLQSQDGMYINGIVLISSVLNLGTISFNPGDDLPYVLYLPSYAAAAAYQKALKDPPSDLDAFLAEARKFAATEYSAALMKGSNITDAEKSDIAKKLSRFTGLSEDYLMKADLRVNLAQFNVELTRSTGITTGRYDSRYTMPTYDLLTEFAEEDPSYTAVRGAFTAGFNTYERDELKVVQEKQYQVLSGEVGGGWDWKHRGPGGSGFFPGSANVAGDLAHALLTNPHLHVQVENGFYDMATPFFATEYTMDHLFLPGRLRGNIDLKYYSSGHMIYLHPEDLVKLKSNIAAFIDAASKQ